MYLTFGRDLRTRPSLLYVRTYRRGKKTVSLVWSLGEREGVVRDTQSTSSLLSSHVSSYILSSNDFVYRC